MTNLNPRIYVACLAAYNNGYLHGKWIDAYQKSEALWDEVNKMLASSPIPCAEEFAIHDFEDFGDITINEYTNLETISEIAAFLIEHDELSAVVLSHTNGDIEEAKTLLEECYYGEFENEEAFAYYWLHEVDGREIPDYLEIYIDYKLMAQDFFINNFFSLDLNHKVHVFRYL